MCDRSEGTALMMKTQKLSLIAAATFLVVLSLPRSSSAQTIDGYWRGFESYTTTVNLGLGQFETYSGSGPASLSIYNLPFDSSDFAVQLSGSFPGSDELAAGVLSPAVFGPTSAAGSIFPFGGAPISTFANFFVTYQSILPDGQIDVGNGGGVADFTSFNIAPPVGLESTTFATFTTVPEPPSIVLAALAALVIAVVARIRGFRARPWFRVS
jgi:hypothetical protein